MKIKGWEKISGYTYKGYTIVNPIHNAEETKYEATILNLNLPQKPKWELSVLTPAHKFRTGVDRNSQTFYITMWGDNKMLTNCEITKERMKSISIFRNTFEEMVDKLLLISANTFSSHSLNTGYSKPINTNLYGTATIVGNTGGGILSTINANSNTITYDPNTNLPSSMLMAIKDLQEQINNLKNNNANN